MTHSETMQSILEAGRREFLEKGFLGASLRTIAKNAGVTTGAFYGYFKSKEDLFEALVGEAVNYLIDTYENVHDIFFEHSVEEQIEQIGYGSKYLPDLVDYIYRNYDAFKLAICCAKGTKYEDLEHRMSEVECESTDRFIGNLRAMGWKFKEPDDILKHILASGVISALFQMIIHDLPYERALEYTGELVDFYTAGWRKILSVPGV